MASRRIATGRHGMLLACCLPLLGLVACKEHAPAAVAEVLAGQNNHEDPRWVHQSSPRAKVAVVFVHGLFGTTTGTWTNANGSSFLSLIKTAPEVGDKIDVFAFGFTSNMFAGGSLDVRQGANKLEESLTYKHVWDYDTVVFVGHSMGGLVVMQELINHRERLPQVPMMVLYSTPQEGTQAAAVGKLLSANPALGQMVPGKSSEFLKGLDDAWSRIPRSELPEVICAYETASTYSIPVVSQFSATRFCDGARVAIGGANHISIVKPDRQEHDSVIRLANALRAVLGTDRNPRVEMPDFTKEGELLVYTWGEPDEQARAKLINNGPLRVRYVLGPPSSEKLMISPTNTPREIPPGEVEELKFDLLLRGTWKSEYRFTLTTSVAPVRTVIVRVPDPVARHNEAEAIQQGVAADMLGYLDSPANKEQLLNLSEEQQQQKLVELASLSLKNRVPSTSRAARWVLTADTLSSLGWPTLAVQALRNAEQASPEITQSPGVQALSSEISAQSGNKAIFRSVPTPQVQVPDDLKTDARLIQPNNAAVLSKLSANLQAVPALRYYGLTLEGDVLQEQGRGEEATLVYSRAMDLRRTPELDAKFRAAAQDQP